MPSTPVLLNQAFDLGGTFTDPESSQSQTVTIDWGDGVGRLSRHHNSEPQSAALASFSNQSHAYSGDGSYIISVTVANSLGTQCRSRRRPSTCFDTAPTTNLVMGGFTVDSSGNLSVGLHGQRRRCHAVYDRRL